MRKKKPVIVELSPNLSEKLDEMAEQNHSTKSDIIRRALILIDLAMQEKSKGHNVAFVDENKNVVNTLVGL